MVDEHYQIVSLFKEKLTLLLCQTDRVSPREVFVSTQDLSGKPQCVAVEEDGVSHMGRSFEEKDEEALCLPHEANREFQGTPLNDQLVHGLDDTRSLVE